MNTKRYSGYIIGGIIVVLVIFFIVSFNSLVKKEEKVKLQWNEVQNTYQRRLDLIPSLVNVVKGVANYEQTVLQELIDARAKASAVNITGTDVTSDQYQQQTKAQDDLAKSANKIIISIEKYPDIQGTKAFVGLQTQLEGTERRIKVARKDFNDAIQLYNSAVRSFPVSITGKLFGFKAKEGFSSDAGAEKVTEIKF